MKELLKQVLPFVTLNFPLRSTYIQQAFIAIHEHYRKDCQGWSLNATRKKVIADYWIKHVLTHFGALYLVGTLISLPFNSNLNQFYLIGLLLGGLISMPILMFWLYGLPFYFDFLPKLDTIIENYERKQLQHLKKCQQAQMSNFAAAVVYYSFAKAGGLQLSTINRQYGEQLMHLFGKDPDDMQKALKLITCKAGPLSSHKQTELEKSITEARTFFKSIGFQYGLGIADQLDRKYKQL